MQREWENKKKKNGEKKKQKEKDKRCKWEKSRKKKQLYVQMKEVLQCFVFQGIGMDGWSERKYSHNTWLYSFTLVHNLAI